MRRFFVVVLIFASLLVWGTREGEGKKKSILDYDEADVERIFQQWEVRHVWGEAVWEYAILENCSSGLLWLVPGAKSG